MEAIRRCFEKVEKVVDVAEGLGYSTASIYKWRRLYLTKGALALQSCNRKNPRGPLEEGKDDFSSAEVSALNRNVRDLKMEVAILKETLNILKKDPGVDVSALRNREKTEIVNALKDRFGLGQLLARLDLPRSVFYYNLKHANDRAIKDRDSLEFVQIAFQASKKRYGYGSTARTGAKFRPRCPI